MWNHYPVWFHLITPRWVAKPTSSASSGAGAGSFTWTSTDCFQIVSKWCWSFERLWKFGILGIARILEADHCVNRMLWVAPLVISSMPGKSTMKFVNHLPKKLNRSCGMFFCYLVFWVRGVNPPGESVNSSTLLWQILFDGFNIHTLSVMIEGSLGATLDNLDRWKSTAKKKSDRVNVRSEKIGDGESQKGEDTGTRKGRKVAKHCFSQWFVAPEGRTVGSLKRRAGRQLARWERKKLEAKSVKTYHFRTTFGS